jgi:type I restriction-modification system DNA methylase subunit
MLTQTKEHLIDKLRNELYNKHHWTGEHAVNFMIPIILAIRQKDAEALDSMPEDKSILWAVETLQEGGKRDLDTILNQIPHQYQGASLLLQETIGEMIVFVTRQPDGIIIDILDYLRNNEDILQAFRDEDFIGTLFERSVNNAFRGDDGRFFTPHNIIILVREMMRMLLEKTAPERPISSYTVCDPCCGSARFLVYWSDMLAQEIKKVNPEINRADLISQLKEVSEQNLFGADIHSETSAYGCLNMLLHGGGATNITAQDSLDHYGFFADMPLLRKFAKEFSEKWEDYNGGAARNLEDIAPRLDEIDARKAVLADLITAETINLSDPEWLDITRIIRELIEVDRAYPMEWSSIRALQRRFKRRAVFETVMDDWASRNPEVSNGFDIITTNPPFGRQAKLMVDNPHLLCQYRLATELWVMDMSRAMTESLLSRTLARHQALASYYIELVGKYFGKRFVNNFDEVKFNELTPDLLYDLLERNGIPPEGYADNIEVLTKIRKKIRQVINSRTKQQIEALDTSSPDYAAEARTLRKNSRAEINRVDSLPFNALKEELSKYELSLPEFVSRFDLAFGITQALGREVVEEADDLSLDQLTEDVTLRVCGRYLYSGGKPGKELAGEIVSYFKKEWLTVEDIQGEDGYASKVTLEFNRHPHTIYYNRQGEPIVYKKPLPKQVLFIEQFLRLVKDGGKIFAVLDTGVLSNLEDEYIRRFIFENAQWWTTVEFPHGAFKAANANVKTAIILLEKKSSPTLDYEVFGSTPRYLGFNLRKQDTPPIFENDLGRVICDFNLFLNNHRLCGEGCPWTEQRYCRIGDEVGMDRSKNPLISVNIDTEEEDVVEEAKLVAGQSN